MSFCSSTKISYLFNSLSQDIDVRLNQGVLLQQVLDTEQMFSVIVGQQSHLQLLHRVQDVDHLLEVVLQLQGHLQPSASGLEQLEKEVPQSEK